MKRPITEPGLMRVVHRVNRVNSNAKALAMVFAATWTLPPCSADEPTVAEITRRHEEWKDSFHSLRLVFELRSPAQWSKRHKEPIEAADLDTYYRRMDWVTVDQGWFRHTEHEFVANTLKSIVIYGDDGVNAYRARYQSPESLRSELPDGVEIENSHITEWPKGYIGGSLAPLEGIRFLTSWLPEHDRKVPFVIDGIEDLHGQLCAVIRQPAISNHRVWLDLQHDALPRHIEPDIAGTGIWFHVDEFRQLLNGHSFPDRGEMHQGAYAKGEGTYWQVIEVETDLPAPPSDFAVPGTGEITRLIDKTGRFTHLPHRRMADRHRRNPDATPAKTITVSTPAEPVAPPSEHGWFWFLLGASMTVLMLGLIWKWTRSD